MNRLCAFLAALLLAAPATHAASAVDLTGAYALINGGYAIGANSRVRFSDPRSGTKSTFSDLSSNGLFAGGCGGYGMSLGPVYAAAEGCLSWPFQDAVKIHLQPIPIKGRIDAGKSVESWILVGWPFPDGVMPYARVGVPLYQEEHWSHGLRRHTVGWLGTGAGIGAEFPLPGPMRFRLGFDYKVYGLKVPSSPSRERGSGYGAVVIKF